MDKKDRLPTKYEIMNAVAQYAEMCVQLRTIKQTTDGLIAADEYKTSIGNMLTAVMYPPSSSIDETHGKLIDKINELVQISIGTAQAAEEGDSGYSVDVCQDELDQMLRNALKPPFSVTVVPLVASNGVTYVVSLKQTRKSAKAQGDLEELDDCITPINRNDLDEANDEGQHWANFLGVPFAPCLPYKEGGAVPNTVPEYGSTVKRKLVLANWSEVAEEVRNRLISADVFSYLTEEKVKELEADLIHIVLDKARPLSDIAHST
jgi:hypothetical protein